MAGSEDNKIIRMSKLVPYIVYKWKLERSGDQSAQRWPQNFDDLVEEAVEKMVKIPPDQAVDLFMMPSTLTGFPENNK